MHVTVYDEADYVCIYVCEDANEIISMVWVRRLEGPVAAGGDQAPAAHCSCRSVRARFSYSPL